MRPPLCYLHLLTTCGKPPTHPALVHGPVKALEPCRVLALCRRWHAMPPPAGLFAFPSLFGKQPFARNNHCRSASHPSCVLFVMRAQRKPVSLHVLSHAAPCFIFLALAYVTYDMCPCTWDVHRQLCHAHGLWPYGPDGHEIVEGRNSSSIGIWAPVQVPAKHSIWAGQPPRKVWGLLQQVSACKQSLPGCT
jgi:hypothetical protein